MCRKYMAWIPNNFRSTVPGTIKQVTSGVTKFAMAIVLKIDGTNFLHCWIIYYLYSHNMLGP